MSKVLSLIKLEPVAIVGLLLAALQAVQDQLTTGVSLKTAIIAGIIVILSAIARQLVTPTAKTA